MCRDDIASSELPTEIMPLLDNMAAAVGLTHNPNTRGGPLKTHRWKAVLGFDKVRRRATNRWAKCMVR